MFAPLLPGGCGYLYVLWLLGFLGSLWAIFDHFHYSTDRAVCTTLHSTKLDFREARLSETGLPRRLLPQPRCLVYTEPSPFICCIIPRSSLTDQVSATLPLPIRYQCACLTETCFPVGARSRKGPVWVPLRVTKVATSSPSAIIFSMSVWRSGKAVCIQLTRCL